MSHPAQFSTPIISVIGDILVAEFPDFLGRPWLHDSFGGDGRRLHDMCQLHGFSYSGTEIEASFINAPGIIPGDACDPATYPPVRFPNETATGGWAQVCSPPYGNGMSDHHVSRDDSVRHTYRKAIATIEGADRPLHESNLGRYGYRGTLREGKSTKREAYWRLADRVVSNWDSALLAIVNVSDFISGGVVEPHVDDWKNLLYKHGWVNQLDVPVGTQRQGNGENRDVRVANEVVIVCRRNP